jgi:hypothetical protein
MIVSVSRVFFDAFSSRELIPRIKCGAGFRSKTPGKKIPAAESGREVATTVSSFCYQK